ncbi:Peptide deformylase [Planctomycetales bacterium 10988]|nr:Peptide deformylase [Planctomycetales bacterium 10988]
MADKLTIIKYPHPTLRHSSKPVKKVDAWLKDAVAQMFELMYEANGIGLAANQVDLPYRLFVLNLSGDPENKEAEQVIINPVLSRPKGNATAEEGCLSFPGVYADVRRPETIHLKAFDLSGKMIDEDLDGLYSRAVQHETDHLDGKLFIDRLGETQLLELKDQLEEFNIEFKHNQESEAIPSPEEIEARLRELEAART